VLAAVESGRHSAGVGSWGRHATNEELEVLLAKLWETTDPQTLANLLLAFSSRPLPRFDARLLAFCDHPDSRVRHRAFSAAAWNIAPEVRELALRHLAAGIETAGPLKLLAKNLHSGDETSILAALNLPADASQRHWLLRDVQKILEENPTADASRLSVIAYAENPCALCRSFSAKLLQERDLAPDWLCTECAHDAEPETRSFFASPEKANLAADQH
jgi:hypothetical protein